MPCRVPCAAFVPVLYCTLQYWQFFSATYHRMDAIFNWQHSIIIPMHCTNGHSSHTTYTNSVIRVGGDPTTGQPLPHCHNSFHDHLTLRPRFATQLINHVYDRQILPAFPIWKLLTIWLNNISSMNSGGKRSMYRPSRIFLVTLYDSFDA